MNVVVVDAEWRRLDGRRHRDVVVLHRDARVQLEELGHVVEEGEGDDGRDVVLGGPPVRDRVERVADREVALHRDGQGGVDGPRQGNLVQDVIFIPASLRYIWWKTMFYKEVYKRPSFSPEFASLALWCFR